MYVFSANATARSTRTGLEPGRQMPFIVYIDFKDLFGAEQLCKVYLIKAGFSNVEIEKRQFISADKLEDEQLMLADSALEEARQAGYMIRMFEEDNKLQ